MTNFAEKRKYPRFKVAIPIDCSGVHFLQTKNSRDISVGGIFIQTELAEKPGTIVELIFLFKEDWEKVKVLGEVIWVSEDAGGELDARRPIGMGIKFIDPPGEFIGRIEKLYLK